MNITFYNVNPKIRKPDQQSYWKSQEFYILPMLRYMQHGDEILLQFRWIVWGINIKLK